MITTAAFSKLQPDTKRQHILEGIEHINAQYAQLTVIAKKLNAWMGEIDIEETDKKYTDRFQALAGDCMHKTDLLTEQILICSQKMRQINDGITKS